MLLYIHVPFCARRCSYCDFAIAVRRDTPSARFVEVILREWSLRRATAEWGAPARLETIYFGGGTPSRLDPEAIADLVAAFREEGHLVAGGEVTLEANPDDVTPPAARAWLAAGINRISLGVQSFDPAVLRWMHRTHTAEQAGTACARLRDAGLRNLSLDLIYGIPEALGRQWEADLTGALALEPEHLSLYALTVEPRTPLGRWTSRGEVVPAEDERVATEFLLAHRRLGQAGFHHYEVSNAAREGFEARHNAGYWRREPFLGLGPSAHSATGRTRAWNLREWEAYAQATSAGEDPREADEGLSDTQLRLEECYLGLRTSAGLPASGLPGDHVARWRGEGWAVEREGRVALTAEGWLRLDALVASLPRDF